MWFQMSKFILRPVRACQGFIVFVAFNVGLEAPPIVTKPSRQGGASSPYADILRPFRAE
jgi:hypothetical protein